MGLDFPFGGLYRQATARDLAGALGAESPRRLPPTKKQNKITQIPLSAPGCAVGLNAGSASSSAEPRFPDLISGAKTPPHLARRAGSRAGKGSLENGPRVRGAGEGGGGERGAGVPPPPRPPPPPSALSAPSRSRLNGHFRNTNNFRNKVTKPPKGALKGRMPGGALLWCGPRPRPNPAFIFTDGRGGSAPGLPAPQEAD